MEGIPHSHPETHRIPTHPILECVHVWGGRKEGKEGGRRRGKEGITSTVHVGGYDKSQTETRRL